MAERGGGGERGPRDLGLVYLC